MAAKILTVHQPVEDESAGIQDLNRLFLLGRAPALLGPDRESIPMPKSIYDILVQVIGYMSEGKGVSVVPVMQELTTQRVANILGFSRPHLIEQLEKHIIPFHKVGTHRRIYLKDVLAYQHKRDQERKKILDQMAKQSLAEGDYDQLEIPAEV